MKQIITNENSGSKVSICIGKIKFYVSAIVILVFSSAYNTNAQIGWTQTTMSATGVQMGSASLGSKVYFAGGKRGSSGTTSNLIDIYDVNSQQWTTATLSVARSYPVGVSLGSKVCFAGGVDFNSGNLAYDVVDIYDTITQQWTTAQLSQARYHIAAVAYGNEILFAGGTNMQMNTNYNIIDKYNIVTGVWSTDSLTSTRSNMGYAVSGSKAYFGGGYLWGNQAVSKRIDIYDFNTGMWSIDSLSVARGFLAAATSGTKVIFAGGLTGSNATSDKIDIYDTSTGIWTIDTLSYGRGFINNSATSCDKAYFVGGGSINFTTWAWGSCYDLIDEYDAALNTITVSTIPSHAMITHSVVSDANHLFIAGGTNFGSIFNAVEIYQGCLLSGIENIGDENTISIAPNPVSDILNISVPSFASDEVQITIQDIAGKVIYSANKNYSNQFQINTSEFADGVYLIQIKTGEKLLWNKFVKN